MCCYSYREAVLKTMYSYLETASLELECLSVASVHPLQASAHLA